MEDGTKDNLANIEAMMADLKQSMIKVFEKHNVPSDIYAEVVEGVDEDLRTRLGIEKAPGS